MVAALPGLAVIGDEAGGDERLSTTRLVRPCSPIRGSELKLFQALDWLPVCGSMSCQMVVMRFLRMRSLRRRRALMRRAACLHLDLRGLCLDSAFAVERVIRTLDNPDHRGVLVCIVDLVAVHVRDDRVMPEHSPFPTSAAEARAEVAVAVIDATVEADLRAPISFVPGVLAADEAPITGRPEESHAGREHPGTGYPVVAIITVLIVARRPNVPVARTGGLIEDGDGRWRDVYRKLNSSEGMRFEEGCQHQNQKHCGFVFHIKDRTPLSAHGKAVLADKKLVITLPLADAFLRACQMPRHHRCLGC